MDTEYGGLQISFQYGQCFAYAKIGFGVSF